MTHNFSLFFYLPSVGTLQCFETQAKSFEDALDSLYEAHENADFVRHDVDLNPTLFESESDTIGIYLDSLQK